jgi:hypothetical protein
LNLVALAWAVAGCTTQHAQHARPVPNATVSPDVNHVATHLVEAPPSSARPAPSRAPAIAIPHRVPDAPPEIVAIDFSSTSVTSGETLWGKVLTSSNVASVEVRVATYAIGMRKIGVGRFALSYRLGYVPFFARGEYSMRIIARNTRGDAVDRTLPLTIR